MNTNNTLSLNGAGLRRYTFHLQPAGTPLPFGGGVYIHARQSNVPGHLQILYVGRAENFRQRHYDHHREHQLAEMGAGFFGWLPVTGHIQQHQIEQELISYYRPPLNGLPVPKGA